MSPAFIPIIKQLASRLTQEQARSLYQRAAQMKTTRQVDRLVDKYLENIAPDLMPLEAM